MNKKHWLLLLFILFLAILLRIWQIGFVPPSPDWDEASLGYNAYSIMLTGKDEYGKFLPVILRSFDDYKPGIYTYFIMPFIPLFGLTLTAVRLPSVIFGVLTVFTTFFLVRELFKGKKIGIFDDVALGIFASFFLAISPWHIQFSRIAFESNIGVAFNVLAVLFFLKALKNPWYLLLSFSLASINLSIYQSEKVFTPLLFLVLICIYWKEFWKIQKKHIIASILLGVLFVMPFLVYTLTNKAVFTRAQGVSVFADQTPLLKNNVKQLAYDRQNNDVLGLIIDNRRIVFAKLIALGYLSHFDLNWLFITGDMQRHHAPGMGLLYLFELPFIFIGLYTLFFSTFSKKTKLLLIAWFLIAPIPASITSGVPHAVRTLNFLPLFPIFTALGVCAFYMFLFEKKRQGRGKFARYTLLIVISVFALFNVTYYLNQYFVQLNYYTSEEWQYGYKDAVEYVTSVENKYDKIVVTNNAHLDQSYMFFLFYLKYPPALYQKESENASGGFRENHTFGKYEFRSLDFSNEIKKGKTLYVGRPDDFPWDARVLKTINFLNGKPAIKIVEG